MPLSDYSVPRDKFELGDTVWSGYDFPCCCCAHARQPHTKEPCRTCDHNGSAVPDEAEACDHVPT